MTTTVSFLSTVDEKLEIKIYGKTVHDLSVKSNNLSKLGSAISFVQVLGIKAFGTCHKLPRPLLALLPGAGQVPLGCSDFETKEFLMWELPKEYPIVTFSSEIKTTNDLVNAELKPFIDIDQEFGIHNLQVNENVISGILRAKLKLHQKLSWPLPDLNVTVVDGNFPFSFNIANACYPVITVGVASAQLCISLNPNKICGQIKFSVPLPFGLHFDQTFTIACVNF